MDYGWAGVVVGTFMGEVFVLVDLFLVGVWSHIFFSTFPAPRFFTYFYSTYISLPSFTFFYF